MILKPTGTSFINTPTFREEVLEKLRELGIDPDALASLSNENLHKLVTDLEQLFNDFKHAHNKNSIPVLSGIDKQILKTLLTSGNVSSLHLSRELNIPLSTIQRRRKRLENELLNFSYSLKTEKLGLRIARLFVSVDNQMISSVDELLTIPSVVSITRTVGEISANLVVEILFRTNVDLVEAIEKIRLIKGVKNVTWSEILDNKTNSQTMLLDYFFGGVKNSG